MKTTEAGELWDQSLRLTEITRKLKTDAGNATHFVVFDACRNKLRLTRAGSRTLVHSKGFVPVAHENGILIAYATAEDKLASDVGAGAGPYAQALAEEIAKPGVECGGNVSQCATTCARHHWSGALAELRSAQSVWFAGREAVKAIPRTMPASRMVESCSVRGKLTPLATWYSL